MVWAKGRRRTLNKTNPKMRNADISKILGEEWRKMSADDKQPYVQQAIYLRRQHKIDHPHYRYRPRRKHHPESMEERSAFFERAMFNSRLLSTGFSPLPNTNFSTHGPRVPFTHSTMFPSGCTIDRPQMDITPDLVFSPKLISPLYSSHLIPSTEVALKDYSFPSHCLSDVSTPKGVLKEGPPRLTSLHQSMPRPGIFSSNMMPYLMVPTKSSQYPY
jgi:hypothetical protein